MKTLLPSEIPVNPRIPPQHLLGPECAHQPEGNGSVFHEEGLILAAFVARHPGHWLEIGAERGVSTRYIMAALQYPFKVYSVDIKHQWPADSNPNRVVWHGDSTHYTSPHRCVGAFIDGDHSYLQVVKDIGTACRCGADIIVFHDAMMDGPDLAASQDLPPDMWNVRYIPTKCGMLVAERIK